MFRNIFCISVLMMLSVGASASIVMGNTRVIYNAGAREVTIPITNRSSKPVLVQSWLDNGDITVIPSATKMPFIIIPPITRVDGGATHTLRLYPVDITTLPQDRESIMWLNVLDVPMKLPDGENKNRLQVALQSRIKFFYRPQGLRGSPASAISDLVWKSSANGVSVRNSGARFVSLVSLASGNQVVPMDMIEPGGFRQTTLAVKPGTPVNVAWIDDNGMTQMYAAVTQ